MPIRHWPGCLKTTREYVSTGNGPSGGMRFSEPQKAGMRNDALAARGESRPFLLEIGETWHCLR